MTTRVQRKKTSTAKKTAVNSRIVVEPILEPSRQAQNNIKQAIQSDYNSRLIGLEKVEIDRLVYVLASPDDVRSSTTIEVKKSTSQLTAEDKFINIEDKAMGAAVAGEICATCGHNELSCPGHFGRIHLAEAFYHPFFTKEASYVLGTICPNINCSRLLINYELTKNSGLIYLSAVQRLKTASILAHNTNCKQCGTKNTAVYKADKKANVIFQIYEGETRQVLASEAYERFKAIVYSNIEEREYNWETLFVLGYHSFRSNSDFPRIVTEDVSTPLGYILEYTPVLPRKWRMPFESNGEMRQNDFTTKYINLVNKNHKFKEVLASFEDLVSEQESEYNTLIDKILLPGIEKIGKSDPEESLGALLKKLYKEINALKNNTNTIKSERTIAVRNFIKSDEFTNAVNTFKSKSKTWREEFTSKIRGILLPTFDKMIEQLKLSEDAKGHNKKYAEVFEDNRKAINGTLIKLYYKDDGRKNSNSTFYALISSSKDKGIRKLLSKRSNFTARSVISPAPDLQHGWMYMPEIWRPVLTKPVLVTLNNRKYINALLKKGEITSLTKKTGPTAGMAPIILWDRGYKVNSVTMDQIEEGDIVDRWLQVGDVIIANRFPTLHKYSIMAARVKFWDSLTIGLNMTAVGPYNADFDGDEMHITVPQSAEAEHEAIDIMNMASANCHISTSNSNPVFGAVYDTLTGAYLMTLPKVFVPYDLFLRMMDVMTFRLDLPEFLARARKVGYEILKKRTYRVSLPDGDVINTNLVPHIKPTIPIKTVTEDTTYYILPLNAANKRLAASYPNHYIEGKNLYIASDKSLSNKTEVVSTKYIDIDGRLVRYNNQNLNRYLKANTVGNPKFVTIKNIDYIEVSPDYRVVDSETNRKKYQNYTVSTEEEWFVPGRMAFSIIWPSNFNYNSGSQIIENGILLTGPIGKGVLGNASNSVVSHMAKIYGGDMVNSFLSNSRFIISVYLSERGFTIGSEDCGIFDNKIREAGKKRVEEAIKEVTIAQKLAIGETKKVFSKRIRAKLAKERTEARNLYMNRLDVSTQMTDIILQYLKADNPAAVSSRGGAKGSTSMVLQTYQSVGPQYMAGEAPAPTISGGTRSSVHNVPNSIRPENYGFISNPWPAGLNPSEYMNAVKSTRDSLLDLLRVADIGYLNRTLTMSLNTFEIFNDGTVRSSSKITKVRKLDANGNAKLVDEYMVLSLNYRNDGLDPSKLINVKFRKGDIPFFIDLVTEVKAINTSYANKIGVDITTNNVISIDSLLPTNMIQDVAAKYLIGVDVVGQEIINGLKTDITYPHTELMSFKNSFGTLVYNNPFINSLAVWRNNESPLVTELNNQNNLQKEKIKTITRALHGLQKPLIIYAMDDDRDYYVRFHTLLSEGDVINIINKSFPTESERRLEHIGSRDVEVLHPYLDYMAKRGDYNIYDIYCSNSEDAAQFSDPKSNLVKAFNQAYEALLARKLTTINKKTVEIKVAIGASEVQRNYNNRIRVVTLLDSETILRLLRKNLVVTDETIEERIENEIVKVTYPSVQTINTGTFNEFILNTFPDVNDNKFLFDQSSSFYNSVRRSLRKIETDLDVETFGFTIIPF